MVLSCTHTVSTAMSPLAITGICMTLSEAFSEPLPPPRPPPPQPPPNPRKEENPPTPPLPRERPESPDPLGAVEDPPGRKEVAT